MNQVAIRITASIVASYVSNNQVPAEKLPDLISVVYDRVVALSQPEPAPAPAPVAELKPAVPIKKSVTPDYIICLEDGMELKMLKRHLRTAYNMTSDEYRAKWGLPPDYPMVAPNYARQRSTLAKEIGLGHGTPHPRQPQQQAA